ncbi:hypothetical protein GpartN1_g6348.t1 [Galdieria partita]|uniref:Asparagine synthetase domain-containing protein n=1 Tax=Galdieria partita TaxID=83374 RepID=A0A9C7UTD0_9RHOD|nr:hypothetical protein GpartN1_g6348.t1 [Galdieria partita]
MKSEQLKAIFRQSLQRIATHKDWNQPSCIILSGGLDTCIVAEEGCEILSLKGAITTIATCTATDEPWASQVAKKTGLEHHIVKTDPSKLLVLLPELIRILKSFDPMELRNSLATFAALKQASSLGFRSCVTGDGADEIFGGYSFTHQLSEQDFVQHRNAMIANMHFSSFPMGRSLGLSVFSPYLDPFMIELARSLTKKENIGDRWINGQHQIFGKLLLRETFADVTSCWRRKDPIEVGSGTTVLGNGYFEQLVDNQSFSQQVDEIWKQDGVYIRDKEHLWYYRIFEEERRNKRFIPLPRKGQIACDDPCPYCGYQLSPQMQTFCTTCGAYDRNLRSQLVNRP